MSSTEVSQAIRDAVALQMESWGQRDPVPPRRARKTTGPSIVYSIRLDPKEVEMLEQQAADGGLNPTGLARNLIRVGLSSRYAPEVADTVDRLEQLVQELRSLVL